MRRYNRFDFVDSLFRAFTLRCLTTRVNDDRGQMKISILLLPFQIKYRGETPSTVNRGKFVRKILTLIEKPHKAYSVHHYLADSIKYLIPKDNFRRVLSAAATDVVTLRPGIRGIKVKCILSEVVWGYKPTE